MRMEKIRLKRFIIITLLTSIWVNISEVFRYFVLVMPRVKAFFNYQSGIAEMDLKIFAVWGVWDTILTTILVFVFWLTAKAYGNTNKAIFIAGTTVWIGVFVIFWVATANMGLCEWSILGMTLPLSWLEMIVGAWIAAKLLNRS